MASESETMLLPCPFCGDHTPDLFQGRRVGWVVGCIDLACEASISRPTRDAVIAAWNRRAPSAEAKDAGEPTRKTWRPMDTAAADGLVLLLVSGGGENRVFAAEQSIDSRTGTWYWWITVGWTGWSRLRPGWEPIGWLPLTNDLARYPDAAIAQQPKDGQAGES